MASHRIAGLVVAAIAAALVFPLAMACAGEFHEGQELHCSHCHRMHAGIANHLLSKTSVNEVCLGCHNGSGGGSTPDVVISNDYVAPPSGSTQYLVTVAGLNTESMNDDPYGSSAGFFCKNYATTSSALGHDLGPSAVTAVQGTWTSGPTGMTCGDCHDVHGNHNFRNIKGNPDGAGADIDVTFGTSGSADVLMSEDLESASTPPTHYLTSHVAFNDSNDINQWCIDCHTNIASSATTKHPVNRSLADASAANVDTANWIAGSGNGFGTTIDDTTAGTEYGVPRVRFSQAGTTFAECTTVAATNKVNCLTCHKAHGSKYPDAQCWPYSRFLDSGGTAYSPIDRASACQQCHNRGA